MIEIPGQFAPLLSDAEFNERLEQILLARRRRIEQGASLSFRDIFTAVTLETYGTAGQKAHMAARMIEEEAVCPDPKRKGHA